MLSASPASSTLEYLVNVLISFPETQRIRCWRNGEAGKPIGTQVLQMILLCTEEVQGLFPCLSQLIIHFNKSASFIVNSVR